MLVLLDVAVEEILLAILSPSTLVDHRIMWGYQAPLVMQAVSLWKAIQTQQWRSESESDSEQVAADEAPGIGYDYRAIEYLLNELHPLGRPLGGVVPRHRSGADTGLLRGVHR